MEYYDLKNKYKGIVDTSIIENNICKLNMEGVKRLFDLYLKYYSKTVLTNNTYIIDSIHDDYCHLVRHKIDETLIGIHILRDIIVDYELEDIEANFEKYGIIILRNPLKSKKILLGCGSKPLIGYEGHNHQEFTTINPAITMNPTIVGAFGLEIGIQQYFIDHNHKFDQLYAEAVTLASDINTANNLADILDTIMIDNYKVYEYPKEKIKPELGRNAFLKSNMIYS